jgi:penicillin-binding protein 1C
VVSTDTARLICSILSDRGARSLGFGAARSFEAPFPAMFKTGTANQYQNIVALGATPQFTVGVWMGNFTGETVVGKTGSSIPAALVRDTLALLQGRRGPAFPVPEDWAEVPVCALSGMAPGSACTAVVTDYVRKGAALPPCTYHHLGPDSRPVVTYPAEYQDWFLAQEREGTLDYGTAPLEILTPRQGFVYLGSSEGTIPCEVRGGRSPILRVTCDGASFTVERPFRFTLPAKAGRHTLTVKNGAEVETVEFTVGGGMGGFAVSLAATKGASGASYPPLKKGGG